MIALIWQTLLILTVAYLAGCIVGCFARRLFGGWRVAPAEPALQAAAPAPAAPALRELSRAAVVPVPAPSPAPAPAAEPTPRVLPGAASPKAFRRADFDTPEDVVPAEAAPEAVPSRPAPIPVSSAEMPPARIAAPVSAAVAVAAAITERLAVPTPAPTSSPDVAARAAFAEPRRATPATVRGRDDLQRIGGVSAEVEGVLNAHDVTRYAQIASWTAAEVERLEGLLGTRGRISRENWIEQAQILARGGVTAYAQAFDKRGGPPAPADASPSLQGDGGMGARAMDFAGMRSVRSEAFRAPGSVSEAAPDDLKRIRGVGLLLERKLNAMGVSTYEQIANWTADDVRAVNARLDFKGRIERENWIEQARILASGGQTDFSRRVERGEV